MIFALLFILAFLVSLGVYLLTNRWWIGTLIGLSLFTISTLSDTQAKEFWSITLIFGLPIVAVASILGAYVVELRRGIEEPDSPDDSTQSESEDVSETGP